MRKNKIISALAGAALAAFATGAAAQETLYGVTDTNLVRIDVANPSQVEVIGPHGLPFADLGDGRTFGAFSLTYDRDSDRLLGLYYARDAATGAYDQYLVQYDRASGAASYIDLLASSDFDGYVEAIEYVDGLGAIVVSRDLDGSQTTSLELVNADGTTTPVVDNGRDNDYAVYDQSRGRFYVTDPNGVGRLSLVDLGTGATMDLGSILSSTGDLAYSADTDRILAYVVGTDELVSLGNGLTSQSPVSLGLVGNAGVIQGLAFATDEEAPPPCPADLDGDGSITGRDFWLFVKYYYRRDSRADINGDGRVNYHDFYAFFEAYFRGC